MRAGVPFVVVFASMTAAVVPAASGWRSRGPIVAREPARIVTTEVATPIEEALDEPRSGLDPALAADVRATLRGDGRTELDIRTPPEWGRPSVRRLRVTRNATSRSPTAVRIKVVAELPGSAIVLVDEYTSAPDAACEGKDAFLRVVAVAGPNAKETFRRQVGSCRGDVRLAPSDALTWDPLASTLEARWSNGASSAAERVRIKGDGSVAPSS